MCAGVGLEVRWVAVGVVGMSPGSAAWSWTENGWCKQPTPGRAPSAPWLMGIHSFLRLAVPMSQRHIRGDLILKKPSVFQQKKNPCWLHLQFMDIMYNGSPDAHK